MNQIKKANPEILLPDIISTTSKEVGELLSALNLPREIVASSEEITYAWRELPRELRRIPEDQRNELVAKNLHCHFCGII
jgi:hypothetical protein